MKMKKSMTNNAVVIINLLAGIIMAAALKIWAKPCGKILSLENGKQMHMRCFYSGQALVILGIILAINALVMLFVNNKIQGAAVAIITSVLSFIVVSDTSFGIGICAHMEMACHVMASWAKLSAGLSIITGIILIILNLKKEK